jgi:antitoxin (DNA-binding transcriptional repressor) of toxin-antitoxin stability system
MEVSITRFRRELFDLVNQAMAGGEVWVRHKDRRFKIVPEGESVSRFSRITPLQIVNPNSSEEDELAMKREMQQAWEKDWETL